MRRIGAGSLLGMSLLAFATACDRGTGTPDNTTDAGQQASAGDMVPAAVLFDTATAQVVAGQDTLTLAVELADRSDQRAYGLMDRDELDSGTGMVFLYDQLQAANSGFWMYRTRIPLDIAFFDGAGRIVAILQMQPCTSPDPDRCQTYAPGVPYYGALEVNHGFLAASGVEVGDQVIVPGRVGA